MADSKFILYVRKFLKNPLLARKQASIELIHPNEAGVDKASIKAKLAKVMKTKEECINIFGLKAKFGGGRSSGFALIYDSVDARKRYDSKTAIKRVSAQLLRFRSRARAAAAAEGPCCVSAAGRALFASAILF